MDFRPEQKPKRTRHFYKLSDIARLLEGVTRRMGTALIKKEAVAARAIHRIATKSCYNVVEQMFYHDLDRYYNLKKVKEKLKEEWKTKTIEICEAVAIALGVPPPLDDFLGKFSGWYWDLLETFFGK